MLLLILGLALFLGVHSVRIFADTWRDGVIASRGPGAWKGIYTLLSLAGFALMIYGYGQARGGTPLFAAPAALKHVTFGLEWLAFICVVAAYWPGNHIKKLLGDPMVFGVGLWALGHLLVKATPAALALFGAFLVWAVVDYLSLRGRAKQAAEAPKPAGAMATILTIVAGTAIAAVFVHLLHKMLIGVAPM